MRSKKTIYLLIVVVLAIWGVIVKKILFPSPQPAVATVQSDRQTPIESSVSDVLRLNYQDPFLKNDKTATASTPQPIVVPLSKNSASKDKIVLPEIVFIGKISLGRKSIYLFEIAKIQYDMRLGDEVDGLKLVRVYPDSVHFKKDGMIFCIKRQI